MNDRRAVGLVQLLGFAFPHLLAGSLIQSTDRRALVGSVDVEKTVTECQARTGASGPLTRRRAHAFVPDLLAVKVVADNAGLAEESPHMLTIGNRGL